MAEFMRLSGGATRAPTPNKLRITDRSEGTVETLVVNSRAFQLTDEEA